MLIVLVGIIIIILVYFNIYYRESFAEIVNALPLQQSSSTNSSGNLMQSLTPIISEKVALVTTPIVSATNSMIQSLNSIPKQLYKNTLSSTKSISKQIKTYADSMKGVARDTSTNSKNPNIYVNERNKVFLDKIVFDNQALYAFLAKSAEKIYNDKEENDELNMAMFLLAYAKYDKRIINDAISFVVDNDIQSDNIKKMTLELAVSSQDENMKKQLFEYLQENDFSNPSLQPYISKISQPMSLQETLG